MEDWDRKDSRKIDSLNGMFQKTTFLSRAGSVLVRAARWQIQKYVIYLILAVILGSLYGYSKKGDKMAGDMASSVVYVDPVGVYEAFKKVKSKSVLINKHPLYTKSKVIKEWELEYGLKFSDLFQYATIKRSGKEKQDFIVMKDSAFDPEDKEKKPLKLELSATFSASASDICEKFYGEVPTAMQKVVFDRKRYAFIETIEDELIQEDGDDKKYFRCVLNQETIDELING